MVSRTDDTLLQCLLALCRYHGAASTPEALTSGLPLESGRLTPSLFERAAKRAGLVSRFIEKDLRQVETGLLPVVLLLENKGACLLMGWNTSGDRARVVYPEINEAVVEIPTEQLLESFRGQSIICRPRFRFDERVPKSRTADREHWFWGAIRANIPVYRDVLFASFFINLFILATPLFIRIVYDRVVPNQAMETLWVLASGVMIILLADLVLRTIRGSFLDLASRRVDVNLSAGIMEKVLGIRLEHRPISVGAFAANLRSFDVLRDFIGSASVTTLIDVPFALVFLLVIGWLAPPILIPVIGATIIIVAYAFLTQKRLQELSETTYRANATRNSGLIESLVGLETIKAMGAESRQQRKWEETVEFMSRINMRMRFVSNSIINFTQWIQHVLTVVVIVGGVYLIGAGELTMGELIAVNILASRAIAPFSRFAGLLTQYHNSKVALENLDELMDLPQERKKGDQFLSREEFRGDIEFKNVSFTYPGAEIKSLDDVSFKIKAGEHVAILGRVGSGKSTMQKLCMGLYQPTEGSIMVDGIDLRQLDPTEFRARVGYVPQEVTLFYGSLRENLVLSHPEATDRDLVRSAEIAGMLEFINRHPRGFDMPIGERGESLSGGQRKSAGLARAMVSDPSILLMDEPTGSMDASTEAEVKEHLGGILDGRTWLVVTHRNSLLEMVDRIIVVDNGRLVADGPRDQVVEALQKGRIGKVK